MINKRKTTFFKAILEDAGRKLVWDSFKMKGNYQTVFLKKSDYVWKKLLTASVVIWFSKYSYF